MSDRRIARLRADVARLRSKIDELNREVAKREQAVALAIERLDAVDKYQKAWDLVDIGDGEKGSINWHRFRNASKSLGCTPAMSSHVFFSRVSPHHDWLTSIDHSSPVASQPGCGRLQWSHSLECAGCSSTPPHSFSISTHSGPSSFSPGSGLAWCAQ